MINTEQKDKFSELAEILKKATHDIANAYQVYSLMVEIDLNAGVLTLSQANELKDALQVLRKIHTIFESKAGTLDPRTEIERDLDDIDAMIRKKREKYGI